MIPDHLYRQLFSSAIVTATAPDGLIVQSAPGRYLMWVLAFLVLVPLSRWCWRRGIGGHFAPGVFFASFAIPLIIIPGVATEAVRISPTTLSVRTGLWFDPTRLDYAFSGLDEVVEIYEAVNQRRVPRRDRVWLFRYHGVETRRLRLPDLLDGNRAPVIEYLRRHGIKFIEARDPAP